MHQVHDSLDELNVESIRYPQKAVDNWIFLLDHMWCDNNKKTDKHNDIVDKLQADNSQILSGIVHFRREGFVSTDRKVSRQSYVAC